MGPSDAPRGRRRPVPMGPALVGTGLRALRPPALWCCTGRWPAFPPGTVSPSPPLPSCRWPQTPCTPVHSTRAHGRISGELESWGAAGRPGLKVHTLVQRARRLLPAVPTHLHGLPQGSRLQPPGPGPAACHGMTPSGATAPTPSPAACRARTPPPHRSSEGARRGRGRRPSWSGDSGVGNRVAGAPGGRRGQHVAGQTPPPAGDAGRTPGSPLPSPRSGRGSSHAGGSTRPPHACREHTRRPWARPSRRGLDQGAWDEQAVPYSSRLRARVCDPEHSTARSPERAAASSPQPAGPARLQGPSLPGRWGRVAVGRRPPVARALPLGPFGDPLTLPGAQPDLAFA